MNWLKVGDVCLESGRTVSLKERVRDVPRVVLRSAIDWRYMERIDRARGAQMDSAIKRRTVECAEVLGLLARCPALRRLQCLVNRRNIYLATSSYINHTIISSSC